MALDPRLRVWRSDCSQLFTLHAGEYLVGAHIEKSFKRAKRLGAGERYGIDLLVSAPQNRATVSLQVKFSKDFLVTHMRPEFQTRLRASGWWTINREKLANPQQTFGCSSFRVSRVGARTSLSFRAGTPTVV